MRYILTSIMALALLLIICSASPAALSGTAYSRPNVSGGYDFYNANGEKIGYSMRRTDGGYDYFDKHGSKTGHLEPTSKSGIYQYYDGENILRGKVTSDPYGGYRYYEQKEGFQTQTQMGVRRNYKYQNPYGGGLDTLPPETIQGKN